MNTVTHTQPGRQGDVVLVKVDKLPEGVAQTKRDEHGRIVLAHGETSGHAHAIRAKSVCGFRLAGSENVDYVEVGGSGPVTLNHELISGQKAEHEPLVLEPGVYRVQLQREYVAPEIDRRAAD